MKTPYRSSRVFHKLRVKAERLLENSEAAAPQEQQLDLMRLAHELEVQYVELELQNEELRRSAKELEASRNAFAELYHSAPVAFVTLSPRGIIEQLNQAAAELLGDPYDLLVGMSMLRWIQIPDRLGFARMLEDAGSQGIRMPVFDLNLAAKQGALQVQVQAAVDHSNGADGHVRLALVDVTARRQYQEALEQSQRLLEERVAERTAELSQRTRQLARLSSELTMAEQRERRRLAEVMHDHLQQMLAGARLNLDIAAEAVKELEGLQSFKDARHLIKESITTARSLSAELSPPVLYMQGLSEALQWLARWMKQTHKLEVKVKTDPAGDPAREDLKVLLFQAVRELLFNVVKHAGTHAARVEMTHRDGVTRVVVSDRGAGFDPGALENRTLEAGAGFGLLSIRERLSLQGGRLEISGSPGRGTRAALVLPLEAVAQKAQAVAEEPGHTAPAAPRGAGPRRVRILLVDDHDMMRKGLAMMLSNQADFEVAGEAANGRQAVELAGSLNPDVVLMDINMPVMNGLEATRLIHLQQPEACIIGLSMHESDDQAEVMRSAGACGYICKTSSPSVLLEEIRRTLQK